MPTVIYSSAALRTKQREVKDAALKDVVHITENGNGAFVFCSEEIFDARIKEAAEEAAYEAILMDAIGEARRDIAAGKYYEGIDAAFAEIEHRREALNG